MRERFGMGQIGTGRRLNSVGKKKRSTACVAVSNINGLESGNWARRRRRWGNFWRESDMWADGAVLGAF